MAKNKTVVKIGLSEIVKNVDLSKNGVLGYFYRVQDRVLFEESKKGGLGEPIATLHSQEGTLSVRNLEERSAVMKYGVAGKERVSIIRKDEKQVLYAPKMHARCFELDFGKSVVTFDYSIGSIENLVSPVKIIQEKIDAVNSSLMSHSGKVSSVDEVCSVKKRADVPQGLFSLANGFYESDVSSLDSNLIGGNDRFLPFVKEYYSKMGIRDVVQYASLYLQNPIGVCEMERRVLASENKLPTLLLASFLVDFHTCIQEAALGRPKSVPKSDDYCELKSVWSLAEGDFLPGKQFVLGDEKTYDSRELLQISRRSPLIQNALIESKLSAVRGMKRGETTVGIANSIFDDFQLRYAGGQDQGIKAGEAMTIGGFMEEGGCCRHRASALALTFQEAGLWARYIRGKYVGGSHAWVYVYDDPAQKPVALFDPNAGKIDGEMTKKGEMILVDDYSLMDGLSYLIYKVQDPANVVWRRKSR